jgi:hypothetical protein
MRATLSDPAYFGSLLGGESWAAWRVLLIAIVGERLDKHERPIFETLTGRSREPGEPVESFWGIIGRRGGKTRAMAVLAAFLAACCDHRHVLAAGERAKLPILAASTEQAQTAFNFIEGVFQASPNLHPLVESVNSDSIALWTGVDIEVRAANFRTIRSITSIAVIADELAMWRSDDSANPDKEIIRALRPTLGTTGGPLICISSPHAKRGELYKTFKRHYGADGHPRILVAKAPTRTMNPSFPQDRLDREYEEDPEGASAEYGAEFRSDLEVFVSREAIESAVARGVTVRAPVSGALYVGFADPAGGSGTDSMTLAIAHLEGERAVLDCVLERRPPFSPDSVVSEFAAVLKSYRVATIRADRWGTEWVGERFTAHGVTCLPADMVRSELYLNFLPMLNSGRVDLLDNARMVAQFAGLERRTSRSGKDAVDHGRDGHDDIANVVAGALVLASSDSSGIGPIRISAEVREQLAARRFRHNLNPHWPSQL